MHHRERLARSAHRHRQNSPLCAATAEGNPLLVADQNGGYARGFYRHIPDYGQASALAGECR